ncbi:bromodomain protein, putative [Bodo saltans]|uniref:Bromodomain protein, putative n=1 Tax=Bodo saltans TaxID=75058 RepID=A0A0S4KPA6_BODSA|nr:bromodomain protein, putative [Bodo saltans]|eukprot:CUI14737.1 bromodomain protein, putative [Bodo saltans]
MTEPDKKKRRHEVNMDKCNALVDAIWKQDAPMAMFQKPVSEAEAPGYFSVIDVPMDLSTMRSKLQTGRYKSNRDVISDARLMLTNALEFNARGDAWYRHAKALMKRLSATIESVGLAKYDDNGDSDDDVFIPQGRVVDKESRLAKDEKKAQEDVPQLLQTLQDDLDIPIEELRKKYANASSAAATTTAKAAPPVPSKEENQLASSDDDDDDHSSLTSDDDDEDEEEESSCEDVESDGEEEDEDEESVDGDEAGKD